MIFNAENSNTRKLLTILVLTYTCLIISPLTASNSSMQYVGSSSFQLSILILVTIIDSYSFCMFVDVIISWDKKICGDVLLRY